MHYNVSTIRKCLRALVACFGLMAIMLAAGCAENKEPPDGREGSSIDETYKSVSYAVYKNDSGLITGIRKTVSTTDIDDAPVAPDVIEMIYEDGFRPDDTVWRPDLRGRDDAYSDLCIASLAVPADVTVKDKSDTVDVTLYAEMPCDPAKLAEIYNDLHKPEKSTASTEPDAATPSPGAYSDESIDGFLTDQIFDSIDKDTMKLVAEPETMSCSSSHGSIECGYEVKLSGSDAYIKELNEKYSDSGIEFTPEEFYLAQETPKPEKATDSDLEEGE